MKKKDKKLPAKKPTPKPPPSCPGICLFELGKPKCLGCPYYR